jgi:WD40 repeat protein
VRVWQDSFAFDEDDEMGDVGDDALSSAVVDVGETKIFTGDVLCLAGFQTATRSPNGSSRFLIAGVADGTVRGWRVVESPDTSKPSNAPVMVPITKRFVETNGGRVQTLFALAEVFPKDDLMSRLVVFGCRDGTLGLVDAETLVASPARVKAHTLEDAFEEKQKQKASGVACLCAGPKNTVASGGDDGIVRLWRAKKRRLSESEKTNDVLSTTGSNSGGDVANVTCVSLEPAGGTRERTGDDGDDVSSPNARGEEEGEKTEKKSAGTRCLCAVRDASGARVGVLAGDRAGGLTLYVAASSQ